jgi:hypothetical protein
MCVQQNLGALNLKILYDIEKETLKQKKHEQERNQELENIFRLDRKMEQMMINKQEEELLALYPRQRGDDTQMPSADILASSANRGREEFHVSGSYIHIDY